jgi:hypothetical protein
MMCLCWSLEIEREKERAEEEAGDKDYADLLDGNFPIHGSSSLFLSLSQSKSAKRSDHNHDAHL